MTSLRGKRRWMDPIFMLVATGGLELTSVHAQDLAPDADAAARSAFEAGRSAYDQGAFADALAQYERAYQLSARPGLLYNIGRAADGDGRYARAIEAYAAYLEVAPDGANSAFTRARLEKLRASERTPSAPPTNVAHVSAPAQGAMATPRANSPTQPPLLPSVRETLQTESVPAIAVNSEATRQDALAKPFWKKAWFWSVVGVAVAGSVTAVVLATRHHDPERAEGDAYAVTPGAP